MVQSSLLLNEERTSSSWRHLASHKSPQRLNSTTQNTLAKRIAELGLHNFHKCKDVLKSLCRQLRSSLPLNLRSAVVEEVVSLQKIEDAQHMMSVVLLHLLTDVRKLALIGSVENGNFIHLGEEDCQSLLAELEDVDESLHIETLQIESITMEEGLISEILRRSPEINTISISGDLSKEILQCLENHPRSLSSLHLRNTIVNDGDVIKALLGSQYEFETLGNMICEGRGPEAVDKIPHPHLYQLTVESPYVTVCGAMVILHYLQNLRWIRYSHSILRSILCLQKMTSSPSCYPLATLELWAPSRDTISTINKLCPNVSHLMIECIDKSSNALQELSALTNLKGLTLRQIPEEEIKTAVKSVGKSLRRLSIEFQNNTCLSLDSIQTVQEHCSHLETLKIENANITMAAGDRLPSIKGTMLPELKSLSIVKSCIHPAILERLVVRNNSLENLFLDVNQDALTDQMLNTMLKYNPFEKLASVYLVSGTMSHKTLSKFVALPALERLSLDVEAFPSITEEAFSSLKNDLVKGNYRCSLENMTHEEK